MKKSFLNQLAAARRRQFGGSQAFTLTELLVVIGVTAMLTAVLLSVSFTTTAGAFRAQCVSNLRQIGVGWNMYSSDHNAMMPCNWPGMVANNIVGDGSESSPWRTHEIERVVPGTSTMATGDGTTAPQTTSGWWNLGIEWENKYIINGKVFYCPAVWANDPNMTWAWYDNSGATPSQPWPTGSSPQAEAGGDDDEIRVAYDYYPQSKNLEEVEGSAGIFLAPVPATTQGGLDVTKCIFTDQMQGYDTLAHRADGIVGANALFPDGHVKWDSAEAYPASFNLTRSGAYAWGITGSSGAIGESEGGGIPTFRYVKASLPP
jgi:prepilin-type processing-associated H-X9-DG protein